VTAQRVAGAGETDEADELLRHTDQTTGVDSL